MKKLKLYSCINLFLAIIFTFLTLSFKADVSVLAFFISLMYSVALSYVVYKFLLKEESYKHIDMLRRFFQYEPFVYIAAFVIQRSGKAGKPYALDLISAILWVCIMVLSFMILYHLEEKRVYKLCPEWEKQHKENPRKKPHGLKRVGIEVLEWIDALIQAVFTIILINIFLFQLYEIPSESMVPTFLIKDRVVVLKTLAGPKFPLSDVGLPYIQSYDRGDIVVFHNPHYKDDRKSEVKSFMSQFVYMITLTLVNTNTDENGELKADPLVKRITGLPGEQLIMMDGVLYSRTKDNNEFTAVTMDSTYAAWDLNKVSSSLKSRIKVIPISAKQAKSCLDVEQKRRDLDLVEAAAQCRQIASEFSQYAKGNNTDEATVKKMFVDTDLHLYYLISGVHDNSVKLITSDGGSQWFTHFMCDWIDTVGDLFDYYNDGSVTGSNLVGGDLYTDSLFRLNVMSKLAYGNLILRSAELISQDNLSGYSEDTAWMEYFNQGAEISDYLIYMDQRNMPVFPANVDNKPQYIPENNYFMMGDNRYNSLDMRHSYDQSLVSLWEKDEYSVKNYTNMEPQYVSKSKILGKASFRFWPLDRIGVPGK